MGKTSVLSTPILQKNQKKLADNIAKSNLMRGETAWVKSSKRPPIKIGIDDKNKSNEIIIIQAR